MAIIQHHDAITGTDDALVSVVNNAQGGQLYSI